MPNGKPNLKLIPLKAIQGPTDRLYNALAALAQIRAEFVLASKVLSDSAFGGAGGIDDYTDQCAVLVLDKAVEHLSAFESNLNDIQAAFGHESVKAQGVVNG